MDPNVQVALVSVIATAISTMGVVYAAVLNNRRERGKAASAGVEAGLDEKNILERMLSLIAENDRKEAIISELKKDLREVRNKNRALERKLRDRGESP